MSTPETKIKEMHATLRRVISSLKNATYVDVGSSNWNTVDQALAWLPKPVKRFLAIEPDPRNIAYLKKNGIRKGVDLIECAVSDFDGEADLIQSDSATQRSINGIWSLSSSLLDPKLHEMVYPGITFKNRVKVSVRTLASICAERGIDGFDFLWADVQGGEKALVLGSPEIIANTRYMFLESDQREMYAGQWTRAEMLKALPNWLVVGEWVADVLLQNTRFNNEEAS